ncbi:MAG: acyl-CoA thioesterase [Verrucomicrobiales bacterium]
MPEINIKIHHTNLITPIMGIHTRLDKQALHQALILRQTRAMNEARERPHLTTREEVMFFDTDCGQVVHNIAYLRMIETCRTRLGGLIGMNFRTMSESKQFPVVTRTEIDYRRPAKLGDWLLIHGTLGLVQRARFWCHFEVRREADNELLITAKQALALVQMPEGKPLRLPKEWQL